MGYRINVTRLLSSTTDVRQRSRDADQILAPMHARVVRDQQLICSADAARNLLKHPI